MAKKAEKPEDVVEVVVDQAEAAELARRSLPVGVSVLPTRTTEEGSVIPTTVTVG